MSLSLILRMIKSTLQRYRKSSNYKLSALQPFHATQLRDWRTSRVIAKFYNGSLSLFLIVWSKQAEGPLVIFGLYTKPFSSESHGFLVTTELHMTYEPSPWSAWWLAFWSARSTSKCCWVTVWLSHFL